VKGEKLGQDRNCRRGHAPGLPPGREMFNRIGARKDGSAGDQR
jgi:hypothetical protein